jgi:hypothetical protein
LTYNAGVEVFCYTIPGDEMKATRQEVYTAIDGEREYQEKRWNPSTTSTGGQHSVTEFLVYMRDYVEEALHHLSRNADPEASQCALGSVRKITTLGVACMEQNGAPRRA